MTNRSRWVGGFVLMIAAAAPALAQDRTPAGRIKLTSGAAFVVRDGKSIPAQAGQVLMQSDAVRTDADGRIGITLNDDTRVSLGPSSELRLERFLYEPAEGRLALAIKFVRGAAAYVSGRIAKLAPDSIRLETPAAIIGVRGTTLAIRVQP